MGVRTMPVERADGSNYRDDSKGIEESADGSNYRDEKEDEAQVADGSNVRDDAEGISEVADGSNYEKIARSPAELVPSKPDRFGHAARMVLALDEGWRRIWLRFGRRQIVCGTCGMSRRPRNR